jgi:hypothetical protein
MSVRRGSGSKVLAWCLAGSFTAALVLGPVSSALAAWSARGAGSAAGAATIMPTASAPGGSASSSVSISWPVATMANGVAVAGYVIKRYDANGDQVTVGAGCSGVVAATSCTEASVAAGTWLYTVTPVQLNWTGGQSPESAPITVP